MRSFSVYHPTWSETMPCIQTHAALPTFLYVLAGRFPVNWPFSFSSRLSHKINPTNFLCYIIHFAREHKTNMQHFFLSFLWYYLCVLAARYGVWVVLVCYTHAFVPFVSHTHGVIINIILKLHRRAVRTHTEQMYGSFSSARKSVRLIISKENAATCAFVCVCCIHHITARHREIKSSVRRKTQFHKPSSQAARSVRGAYNRYKLFSTMEWKIRKTFNQLCLKRRAANNSFRFHKLAF